MTSAVYATVRLLFGGWFDAKGNVTNKGVRGGAVLVLLVLALAGLTGFITWNAVLVNMEGPAHAVP